MLLELGRLDDAIALADRFKSDPLRGAHIDLMFDHDVEAGVATAERFAKEAPQSRLRALKYAKCLIGRSRCSVILSRRRRCSD